MNINNFQLVYNVLESVLKNPLSENICYVFVNFKCWVLVRWTKLCWLVMRVQLSTFILMSSSVILIQTPSHILSRISKFTFYTKTRYSIMCFAFPSHLTFSQKHIVPIRRYFLSTTKPTLSASVGSKCLQSWRAAFFLGLACTWLSIISCINWPTTVTAWYWVFFLKRTLFTSNSMILFNRKFWDSTSLLTCFFEEIKYKGCQSFL